MVERKLEEIKEKIMEFNEQRSKSSILQVLETFIEEIEDFEILHNRHLSQTEFKNHEFYKKFLTLQIEREIKDLQSRFRNRDNTAEQETTNDKDRNKEEFIHFDPRQEKYLEIYFSKQKTEPVKRHLISLEILDELNVIINGSSTICLSSEEKKQDSNDPEDWITTEEVCRFLGVTERTLFNYVKSGKLTCYQPSKKVRKFRMSDVIAFLENSKIKAPKDQN